MLLRDLVDGICQEQRIPPHSGECLLEYLVEQGPVDKRRRGITRGLDTVLEHSAAYTAERICYNGGGYELVRMQNQRIMVVVNDALPVAVKVPQDVHPGVCVGFGVIPLPPEQDNPDLLRDVCLQGEHL